MNDNASYVKDNELIWDSRAENGDRWSLPVSAEETAEARRGNRHIVLTPEKPVPRDRFPQKMAGARILCLASGGGGQLGPILAAAGAEVTVFDPARLERGELVPKYSIPYADIDHLDDETIRGITEAEGYSRGHPVEDNIGGQIAAGFAITGFYEDRGFAALDDYINTSMATKAVKL